MVLGLTATIALERLAHDSLPSTWVLYTTYRFNWTEFEVGMSLAAVGIMYVVVSGGLTGFLVGRWGERKALRIGLIISATEFLLYGLASEGWMFYGIIVVGSVGGIAGPAMQALITKMIPVTEQGAVQGALSSIRGMTAIVGPLIATNLFGYFTSEAAPVQVPGAAFLASAVLVAVGAALAIRSLRRTLAMESVLATAALAPSKAAAKMSAPPAH